MPLDFTKVSTTARLTAYMRQFSDIPFAKDVARELRAREAFEAAFRDTGATPDDLLLYAPILEVRYKSIAQAILKSGVDQVLELASGFSLRGLAMARERDLTYVESDLAELTREKSSLIDALSREHDLGLRDRFHLAVADALDPAQLHGACAHFRRDRKVAVVNEGLLLYMSPEETRTIARNIRDVLAGFGGVWITTDLAFKEDVRNAPEPVRVFRRVISAATEREMMNNAFDDDAELLTFFADAGLRVMRLNQVDETPTIVSLAALDLPRRALEQARPGLNLWILAPDSR
jgi:O-methyltransferase involved in polyketide biosynthesis